MDVQVQSYKRADIIKVTGRVDSSNVSEFESALRASLDAGRHHLVADLSGIDYMSSAGLRALVATLRECKRHSGDLIIAQPSSRMREVLTLAGLDSVFAIYDDPVAAVANL
jgi:anti-anti-sigma factor